MGIGKFFQIIGTILGGWIFACHWNANHGFPYGWLGQSTQTATEITYVWFLLVCIFIMIVGLILDKWKVK